MSGYEERFYFAVNPEIQLDLLSQKKKMKKEVSLISNKS
jgi:hypothetical protein